MEAKYAIKNGVLSLAPPGTEANIKSANFVKIEVLKSGIISGLIMDCSLSDSENAALYTFQVIENNVLIWEADALTRSPSLPKNFAVKIEN